MNKKLKNIPVFKSEDKEREFWATHDSFEYVNWDKAEEIVFPNLKPTVKPINIRLPEWMLARIKSEANKNDIPYQTLIKIWLSEKLRESQMQMKQ